MRSFIAIKLPLKIRAALTELQQELKKCNADIRWVKPDNIHLTLKFLGEFKEERVKSIVDGLKDVCGRHEKLSLDVKGIGVFPNRRSPRVLWVDILGDELLAGLQRDIEKAMSLAGFKAEKRRFTAHLTIGRFRSLREKDLFLNKIDLLADNSLGFMEVMSVALMRSDLSPAGAEYTSLAEVPLKGA